MRDNLDERLLAALQRQQMTPADLRAQMAADQAAQAGVNTQAPVTLADSGPAMRDLAYAIKAQPGPGKTAAEQFLEARQRGAAGQSSQYDRMANATREAFQAPQSAAAVEDALTAGRSAQSKAAYDRFRLFAKPIPVEDILQAHAAEVAHAVPGQSDLVPLVDKAHSLFTNEGYGVNGVGGATRTQQARYNIAQMRLEDQIARAQAAGNKGLANELTNLRASLAHEFGAKTQLRGLTELNPAQFDAAKKQLDDLIGAEVRSGNRYNASILTDLKSRLVQRADQVTALRDASGQPILDANGNPRSLYGDARSAFEQPTRQLDALQQGREIFNADPERVAAQVGALPPTEQAPYRTGAAAEFLKRFGDKRSGNNIPDILDTPNMQTRLGAAAGQPQADKLNAYAGLEQRMAQTRNRVMGNSKTAENQALQQDFALATRLGRHLKEGKVLGAAADAIATAVQRLYRYREQDARLLARDLFATDPKQREATIQRLENVYGRRAARAAVSTAVQTARGVLAKAAVAPIVGDSEPLIRNYLAPRPGVSQNALLR